MVRVSIRAVMGEGPGVRRIPDEFAPVAEYDARSAGRLRRDRRRQYRGKIQPLGGGAVGDVPGNGENGFAVYAGRQGFSGAAVSVTGIGLPTVAGDKVVFEPIGREILSEHCGLLPIHRGLPLRNLKIKINSWSGGRRT
jgi:hypothetical protein